MPHSEIVEHNKIEFFKIMKKARVLHQNISYIDSVFARTNNFQKIEYSFLKM